MDEDGHGLIGLGPTTNRFLSIDKSIAVELAVWLI
jgi:hypothetical protein